MFKRFGGPIFRNIDRPTPQGPPLTAIARQGPDQGLKSEYGMSLPQRRRCTLPLVIFDPDPPEHSFPDGRKTARKNCRTRHWPHPSWWRKIPGLAGNCRPVNRTLDQVIRLC